MEQPPRSPDCNPIEHLWDELGRAISSMDNPTQNLDGLRQTLLDKWAQIPVQRLQRLVASMPRRLAAIIAARCGNTRYWPGTHKTRPPGSVTKCAVYCVIRNGSLFLQRDKINLQQNFVYFMERAVLFIGGHLCCWGLHNPFHVSLHMQTFSCVKRCCFHDVVSMRSIISISFNVRVRRGFDVWRSSFLSSHIESLYRVKNKTIYVLW